MFGESHITREIMGNVPGWLQAVFYVFTALALLGAAAAFVNRTRKWRVAKRRLGDDAPKRPLLAKIGSVVTYLTFHKQLLRDRYAGTAHLLMFYGFFVLFIGTCLVGAEGYGQKFTGRERVFFYGWFYKIASLVIDLGGVAFLVGIGMFLYRRVMRVVPGSRRILDRWWVDAMSWLLLAIGVTGFFLEGARIARDLPGFERWSVVGYALALAMRGVGLTGEGTLPWHRFLWGFHATLCVAFFALLPWKFVSHMTYGAVSWANRTLRPRGQLRAPEPGAPPGAAAWKDLAWRDLMQADACTTCGRCNAVCPATTAGKPLQPRDVVLGLRAAVSLSGRNGHALDLRELVSDAVIWSCTTCGACNHACPVGIEVFDKIIELRRGRIEEGRVPTVAERVFESTAESFNPFGKPASERMTWATGLDVPIANDEEEVELLYWIGCAGAFDADGQSVSRSMIKILESLGVKYRVLGKRERCTGDPARRMGEEGLFQQLAKENLDTLRGHKVKKILTHCPHCFNTFRNEYPQLARGGVGATFEVEHHTQFLARMVSEGRLKAGTAGKSITFHDPCYLGRANGVTEAPRVALTVLGASRVTETPRHGEGSFCCGAGGGSMWLDVKGTDRVENIRAREAAATGATTVATGCPFCKSMLRAGAQSVSDGKELRVRDLAELIAEAQRL